MSIDPTKRFSNALVFQDIERRLASLERSARGTTQPLVGATDSTYRSLSLSGSYASFSGAVSVKASVPPSGRLAVWLAAEQTLEGDAYVGMYASLRFAGVNSIAPLDSASLRFFVGGGGRSAWFYVVGGLTPGPTTLSMEARHTGVAPSIAGLGSQTLMVASIGSEGTL